MTTSLAIDGGLPVRNTPMPKWPSPGDEEVRAVEGVLRAGKINYWTGDEGRLFETEYAKRLGRKYGLSVANGTLALELALRAFGMGAGDDVVVPSRTFIATAASVVNVGARPVVADVDPDSGNITAQTMLAALTPSTRAVLPVHVGGWPVEMEELATAAAEHDLVIIEDCAQAHEGALLGRPVGNLWSHAAAFSFCQDKILPSGEGGLVVLDNDAAYDRAWSYRDHGKSRAKMAAAQGRTDSSFKFVVDSFGSNWRMEEMAAALARAGLAKLPEWHAARTRNAHRLTERLAAVEGLRVPVLGSHGANAYYRLYAYVDLDRLADGWTRDRIIAAISAEGCPCQYGSCAVIYREEAFANAGIAPAAPLPVAEKIHETSLAFFVHPTLSGSDIDDTAEAVAKVMKAAVR